MPEKIKITKAELDDLYDVIDEDGSSEVKGGEVVETDNMITETFDDAVERKSKEELARWHLDNEG